MRENTASSTALVIARSTWVCGRGQQAGEGELWPREAVELSRWFLADHAADWRLLQSRWYRWCGAWLERWIIPGIQLHYAARKLVVSRSVEAAIRRGARQVVVIAAGFDTLAYRLHRHHPSVRFIEIDHPATQALKRRSLESREKSGENFEMAAADLERTPLAEALVRAGARPNLPAVAVMEGLLMYLEPDQAEACVATLSGHFEQDLTLALTFMVPDARGRARFQGGSRWLDLWLGLNGEPFRSVLTREEMSRLLRQAGFGRQSHWDHDRLRAELLGGRTEPLAHGEQICVASRPGGTPRGPEDSGHFPGEPNGRG